jgi:hypothetical protein
VSNLIVASPLLVLIVLFAIGIACERYIRRHPRNRRVRRSAWPKRGTVAPPGYFADATQRPGPECAGKVG